MLPGGRKRGQKNRRTLSGKDRAAKLAPAAWKRLASLVEHADSDTVSLAACRLILNYAHGRPPPSTPDQPDTARAWTETRAILESVGRCDCEGAE